MKPTDLRGILQYIPQFREKTFVLSIDGVIVTDENFVMLLQDVAVLRSLSIRVVIVHGASAQIKALGEKQGVTPSNSDGTGITDAPTLQIAMDAANRLTHEILEGLAANDLRAVCPNAIVAHPLGILQGVDQLYTGKVERVDTDLLQTLLSHGIVPVIPPLGFDGDGKTYRVNSDSVAVAVAEALKATKLIYVTAHDGIHVQGRLIRQMLVADLESVLAISKNDIAPEQLSKATHAVAASKAGIPRVHVINGKVDEGVLAEVFSNEGIGTLIYANEYQQIRRAMKKDVRAIQLLTKQSVESSELVKRTRSTIEKNLNDYFIFEIDKNPVACVALHVYPEQKKGELACLYVSPSHENRGIGKKLIQFIENKAKEMNLAELIALSTQTFTYFQSKGGFSEGVPDDLPPARREKYEASGRNSKVLVKKLK
ncbi:MAG TPA: amino-acid N-acetyltransferase [Candidatus Sulfotelmatobacter sp.]|jgi:amino-acid N-acetyltransferase|nr:amino-acid N-acetyltransferase [Candidatus Sulfotelmatobacter sp.]